MPCKMTLFFNEYQSGFSETFYHSSDDPATLEQTVPNSLYQLAVKFRHNSVFLKAARFSRVGGRRVSILHRPYPKAQGTRATVGDPGPDPVSTTAVYQLYSTGIAKRLIWCRGLADVDVSRDVYGNDIESSTLYTMRNEYFQALFQAGFKIQFVQRPPEAALTWRNVISVSHGALASPNRAQFYLFPEAPLLNTGDVVSFTGTASDLPRWPRKATILSQSTTAGVTNYVIAYQLPGGVQVVPRSLKLTSYLTAYETISKWAFVRFGEHKTGRPFGSLRGRSRGAGVLR